MNEKMDFSKISEITKELGKVVTDIATKPKLDFSLGEIPRLDFPVYELPDMEIPENPLIKINEDLLEETKKLNATVELLHKRIDKLEFDAVESEKQNRRLQWKTAITSALIGAAATFFGTFFV